MVFSQFPELEGLISPLVSPEEQLEQTFLVRKLQRVFGRLLPHYKKLLQLKYQEGLSVREIAKKFKARVYLHREENLGEQRAYGLKKVTNDWVLVLDSDEVVSVQLRNEIKEVLSIKYKVFSAFRIPFQNHFLGKPIKLGGENYSKLILFQKNQVKIKPSLTGERFELKVGKAGGLKNKIFHYSYRTLTQMYKKFTDYAIRDFKEKAKSGEKGGLKKIILYPMHMFWARFVKDKGYKDGLLRIPLDLGFAYMEYLTYFLLTFYEPKKLKK